MAAVTEQPDETALKERAEFAMEEFTSILEDHITAYHEQKKQANLSEVEVMKFLEEAEIKFLSFSRIHS